MTELVDEIPKSLRGLVRLLVASKNIFVSLAGLIMALTFFFVVIFRYIFELDLFAYEEWLMVIVFWSYLLGGALGSYHNLHINADILDYTIHDPVKLHIKRVIVVSIEAFIAIFFTYWATLMLHEEISAYPGWQTTIALKIPFFIPRLGIAVGFYLMTFYTFLRLYVLITQGPQKRSGLEAKNIEAEGQ